MPTAYEPALLLLPRLRVQHANAISSPLTWGFPAITAFLGLMTALERKLGPESGLRFRAVGVICHRFEAQVADAGYGTRQFCLSRNPVQADGSSAAIVEEGRVHLELSLLFDVELSREQQGTEAREALAQRALEALQSLRVAGGSLLPPTAGPRRRHQPLLLPRHTGDDDGKQFARLMRQCLPGFALVLRDDLLAERLAELRGPQPNATPLDAWLSLSRLTQRAQPASRDGEPAPWVADARPGWLVPIPVGFGALSALHAPGSVRGARDGVSPFRFVETLWSIGQWVSPHRIDNLLQLVWYPEQDVETGSYRCRNQFIQPESF